MKKVNGIVKLMLISVILMSSCQIEKRVYRKGFHVRSNISMKGKNKTKMNPQLHSKRGLKASPENEAKTQQPEVSIIDSIDTTGSFNKNTLTKPKKSREKGLFKKHKKGIEKGSVSKGLKKYFLNGENPFKLKTKSQNTEDSPKKENKRKIAIIVGASLIAMTILAAIAFPALGTLAATIALIGIFLLDIIVSWGVNKYHKDEKPKLAKTSGILRGIYTAILGIAIGYQIGGNIAMFNHVWGLGLIVFGAHLITLGIMYNNEGGKKWVNYLIKSLLILAGVGYLITYIGMFLVPNPASFVAAMDSIFMIPMVLGELLYALWMILKGGKKKKKA